MYIYIHVYQSPLFEVVPRTTQDLRRRTEITPVEDSHTRIKKASSFLNFVTNVCNAAKELTEQNPQAFKQHWWKRIACEFYQTNVKLALQRAAAARRALFRLPAGVDGELQNGELQTDLPAEVAGRSSHGWVGHV
jgi:hypothetical protein